MDVTKRFNEIHKAGAEKFGINWLHFNDQVIEVATMLDIDYTDEPIKTLLPSLAYEIALRDQQKRDLLRIIKKNINLNDLPEDERSIVMSMLKK